ncbi:MAG: DUF2007 domain-containing protein [Pseudomonadales bacterium]|nr:DUF2007 domain-containing protein [Pseudomonadales bacterium]
MRQIYTNTNRVLIMSAKNLLQREGIESFVKNDHSNTSGGEFGIANMFLELWIHNDIDYEKASDIIAGKIENPEIKESWICPACKEKNDGSFDFCWQCQAESNL